MRFGKKEGVFNNKKSVLKDFYPIIILISIVFILALSVDTYANTPTITLNFTSLLPNQTITATTDVNITFNATYDQEFALGNGQHNVSLLFYNNTGTTFVTMVNFTSIINGSLGSYYFNSNNYTKGDTIVFEAYIWNGIVNSSFVNISSFINGTDNNSTCLNIETCEYQNLTECLNDINNTLYNTCILKESNYVETFRKTFYNITGTIPEVYSSDPMGIIEIKAENTTIDLSGTIFIPANISALETSQYVFWTKSALSKGNITLKNIDASAFNGSNYFLMNGLSGSLGHTGGTNNITLMNIKGDVGLISGNYWIILNYTGTINKIEPSTLTSFKNMTIINSTVVLELDNRNDGEMYVKDSYIDYAKFGSVAINSTLINVTIYDILTIGEYANIINSSTGEITISANSVLNNVTILNNSDSCMTDYGTTNNVTIKNSVLKCNGTDSTPHLINPYGSWKIINNVFNITGYSGYNCLQVSGNDNEIINNTFYRCGNKSYVTDEYWTANETYRISYSPFTYNSVDYDACVRIYDSALAQQTITTDYTLVTDPDVIVDYQLWLITDTANALGCGGTKKLTLWVASDYANPCDVIVPAVGGTCDYNSTKAFIANGFPNSYTWNTTIINATIYIKSGSTTPPYLNYYNYTYYTNNSRWTQDYYAVKSATNNNNITGNNFYNESSNVLYTMNITGTNNYLWYNNFYEAGTQGGTGCYNNIGNFYDYRISYSDMAGGECGLINITSPSSQSSSNPITIIWTPQSSTKTINYSLEYVLNNERKTIGSTTGTSYNWSVPSNGNFTINIIPMQNPNGTNRNSTVLIDIPEQTEGQSSIPSGGSSAKDTTLPGLMTQILENIAGFRTDISETALNVIVGEIKTQEIKLTNPTEYNLIIKVIPDKNLADIIKPSENYFLLKPDETKTIIFDILAKEPGEYKGIIKLVSDKYQRVIDVNIIAKAGQIEEIKKAEQIDRPTFMDKIRSFFIWIGKLIEAIVNWFKELF